MLGGEQGLLGPPKGDQSETDDGRGLFREYRDGVIFWSQGNGAWEVRGNILSKWIILGREAGTLGYPVTGELVADDRVGRYNHFEKGSIYLSPHGAHEITGPIKELWESLGFEKSDLGYPTSGEIECPIPGTCFQMFEHGRIYFNEQHGAYEVLTLSPAKESEPSVHGHWGVAPLFDSKVVAIHAALLHMNRVLFFSHGDLTGEERSLVEVGSAVLNLKTRTIKQQQMSGGGICSGHSFLPDGRLVACGSERKRSGAHALRVFTPGGPDDGEWGHVSDIEKARWYPTCVTLPDGRVIIIGGHNWLEDENTPNKTYEIFDSATGLQGVQPMPLPADGEGALFPFTFVLPDKRLFIHAGTRTRFLNLETWQFEETTIEAADRPGRNARSYDIQGTAVLLPLLPDSDPPYRARVMLIGGGGAPEVTARTPATDSCEILDLGAPSPAWELAAPMANPRILPDATLLPDGTVLVTGGSYTGKAEAAANPVLQTELYDPRAGTWATLCSMSIPRLYHSIALLTPTGEVLTAGMDSVWYPAPYQDAKLRIEFFSPPYLHNGPRPIITGAPGGLAYGAEFEVRSSRAGSIKSAALLSPSSVTHSFNSHQRYVGLKILDRRDDTLRMLAPPDAYVAPPGYYMLFLVSDAGIPSASWFINLG